MDTENMDVANMDPVHRYEISINQWNAVLILPDKLCCYYVTFECWAADSNVWRCQQRSWGGLLVVFLQKAMRHLMVNLSSCLKDMVSSCSTFQQWHKLSARHFHTTLFCQFILQFFVSIRLLVNILRYHFTFVSFSRTKFKGSLHIF